MCMYVCICVYVCMHIYIYIVVTTKEFSENKVLNIVNGELLQLKLHLLPHVAKLCFTYADDDDDLQTLTIHIYVKHQTKQEIHSNS